MRKPIKVGIIGVGKRFFNFYLDLLSRASKRGDVEVVMLYNRTRSNGEKAAKILDCRYTDGIDDVLGNHEIDAILNVLKGKIKDKVALQVLAAGKHMFLETPAAHTSIVVRRLLDLARRNNLKVGVAEDFAFFPESQLQRQIVSFGILGKPLAIFNDEAGFAYHAMARLGFVLSDKDKPISYKFFREKIWRGLAIDFLRIKFKSGIIFFQRFPNPKGHFFRQSSQWRILCEKGVLSDEGAVVCGKDGTPENKYFNKNIINGSVRSIEIEIGGQSFSWLMPDDMAGWDYKKYTLAFLFDNFISSLITGQSILYDLARAERGILMWRSSCVASKLNLPTGIPSLLLSIIERFTVVKI